MTFFNCLFLLLFISPTTNPRGSFRGLDELRKQRA